MLKNSNSDCEYFLHSITLKKQRWIHPQKKKKSLVVRALGCAGFRSLPCHSLSVTAFWPVIKSFCALMPQNWTMDAYKSFLLYTFKSLSHFYRNRMVWVGWDLEAHLISAPATGKDTFHYPRDPFFQQWGIYYSHVTIFTNFAIEKGWHPNFH